jgi:hypothetical protein
MWICVILNMHDPKIWYYTKCLEVRGFVFYYKHVFKVCNSSTNLNNVGLDEVWHSNKLQTYLLTFKPFQTYIIYFNATMQVL